MGSQGNTTSQDDIRITRTTQDGNVGVGWATPMESKDKDLNQEDCRDTVRTTKDTTRRSQDKLRTSNATSGCVVIKDEKMELRKDNLKDNFRDEECCMEDVQCIYKKTERDLLKDE